jgi:parallel beta-helix repeat protein
MLASGHSTVAYQSNSNGNDQVYYRNVDASGVPDGDEVCMTPDSVGTCTPSISVDGSGYAYLTWTQTTEVTLEIYVKRASSLVLTKTSLLNNLNGITISFSCGVAISANTVSWGDGYGIYLDATNNVMVRDNTVEHNDVAGICIKGCDANVKSIHSYNNIVYANRRGIEAVSSRVEITGGTVIKNYRIGPGHGGDVGEHTGIHIESSVVSISGVELEDNYGSIEILSNSIASISGCSITETPLYGFPGAEAAIRNVGVGVSDSQAIINSNTFVECGPAIAVVISAEVTVSSNVFSSGSGDDYPGLPDDLVGIWATIGTITEVNDNHFLGMRKAVYLEEATASIVGNIIEGCENGIEMYYCSPYIKDNIILGSSSWGILSYYAAPSNSEMHGDGLIADNTFNDNFEGDVAQLWWVHVRVEEEGNPVSGDFVEIYESGTLCWSGFTDTDGYTEEIIIEEYSWDSLGLHLFTPHSIIVTHNGVPEERTKLVTENWLETFSY